MHRLLITRPTKQNNCQGSSIHCVGEVRNSVSSATGEGNMKRIVFHTLSMFLTYFTFTIPSSAVWIMRAQTCGATPPRPERIWHPGRNSLRLFLAGHQLNYYAVIDWRGLTGLSTEGAVRREREGRVGGIDSGVFFEKTTKCTRLLQSELPSRANCFYSAGPAATPGSWTPRSILYMIH